MFNHVDRCDSDTRLDAVKAQIAAAIWTFVGEARSDDELQVDLRLDARSGEYLLVIEFRSPEDPYTWLVATHGSDMERLRQTGTHAIQLLLQEEIARRCAFMGLPFTPPE